MREVLASLKPYYYYLVGEGIKEVEVRKSIPKSNDWDKKVFFYMSKDEKSFAKIPKEYQEKYRRHFGKVGLQFVCDCIDEFHEWELSPSKRFYEEEKSILDLFLKESCLTYEEVCEYRKNLPSIKPLFCWHISDLKIYDKPKELSEFGILCDGIGGKIGCNGCEYYYHENTESGSHEECCCNYLRPLKRPPQSWCYVEVE